jgi:hypothetical protein
VSFRAEDATLAGTETMASRMVPVVALTNFGSAVSVAAARVSQGVADHPGGSREDPQDPFRRRCPTITGAPVSVVTVVISAFSPRTPE